MVRQAFDLLDHPVGRERFEDLNNVRVQYPPLLQQETAVSYLVRQSMLEGVFLLGEQAGVIQELRRLHVCQTVVQCLLGHIRNGPQQGKGHVCANHGSSLEQGLSSDGRRSMPAARTACTVAGTGIPWRGCTSR